MQVEWQLLRQLPALQAATPLDDRLLVASLHLRIVRSPSLCALLSPTSLPISKRFELSRDIFVKIGQGCFLLPLELLPRM